jgi:hypothetical protein
MNRCNLQLTADACEVKTPARMKAANRTAIPLTIALAKSMATLFDLSIAS